MSDSPSTAADTSVTAIELEANHKVPQDKEQGASDQQPSSDAVSSSNVPESEANGHSADVEHQVDPVEWNTRMWFVKVPKPQEDAALLAMEQEHDSLKAQMNLLSETFKITKVHHRGG